MWFGSPDRSRTCIYRFIPATAFAAAFRRLWSGLSHNRGAKRALAHRLCDMFLLRAVEINVMGQCLSGAYLPGTYL